MCLVDLVDVEPIRPVEQSFLCSILPYEIPNLYFCGRPSENGSAMALFEFMACSDL
jgi:hypothetical protein